jgi:hypothetical protein
MARKADRAAFGRVELRPAVLHNAVSRARPRNIWRVQFRLHCHYWIAQMSFTGHARRRFRQWRERRIFRRFLENGDAVFQQKLIADKGDLRPVIRTLNFKDGPTFKVRDGAGAAYIFYEIFVRDQYPKAMLRDAETIVDVGAIFLLCSTLRCASEDNSI